MTAVEIVANPSARGLWLEVEGEGTILAGPRLAVTN